MSYLTVDMKIAVSELGSIHHGCCNLVDSTKNYTLEFVIYCQKNKTNAKMEQQ
jgi:hypothetical protein